MDCYRRLIVMLRALLYAYLSRRLRWLEAGPAAALEEGGPLDPPLSRSSRPPSVPCPALWMLLERMAWVASSLSMHCSSVSISRRLPATWG